MTMHVPPESVPTTSRHFLDWRFIAALACLVLVMLLAYGGWRNYELREEEVGQRDRLIAQVEARADQVETLEWQIIRLQGRINGLHEKSREDRRESRREQRVLMTQLERMIRLLRVHGIRVHNHPATSPRRSSSTASGSTSPRRSTSSTTPRSRPRAQATPKRQPVTAGKSGKTPGGKAKGLRRGKRR